MRPFLGVISRGHNVSRSTAHPAAARRRETSWKHRRTVASASAAPSLTVSSCPSRGNFQRRGRSDLEPRQNIHKINMTPVKSIHIIIPLELSVSIAGLPVTL